MSVRFSEKVTWIIFEATKK